MKKWRQRDTTYTKRRKSAEYRATTIMQIVIPADTVLMPCLHFNEHWILLVIRIGKLTLLIAVSPFSVLIVFLIISKIVNRYYIAMSIASHDTIVIVTAATAATVLKTAVVIITLTLTLTLISQCIVSTSDGTAGGWRWRWGWAELSIARIQRRTKTSSPLLSPLCQTLTLILTLNIRWGARKSFGTSGLTQRRDPSGCYLRSGCSHLKNLRIALLRHSDTVRHIDGSFDTIVVTIIIIITIVTATATYAILNNIKRLIFLLQSTETKPVQGLYRGWQYLDSNSMTVWWNIGMWIWCVWKSKGTITGIICLKIWVSWKQRWDWKKRGYREKEDRRDRRVKTGIQQARAALPVWL